MWETQFNKVKENEHKKLVEDDAFFDIEEVFPRNQFIENTHIKFLQSAGARVVPVDWQLDDERTNALLEQINGLYIPGDSKSLVQQGNF